MDFEKEMQKSLKIIFQNIQALEDNRVQLPNKFREDLLSRCNRRNDYKDAVRRPLRRQLPPTVMPVVAGSVRSVSNPRKMLFV